MPNNALTTKRDEPDQTSKGDVLPKPLRMERDEPDQTSKADVPNNALTTKRDEADQQARSDYAHQRVTHAFRVGGDGVVFGRFRFE